MGEHTNSASEYPKTLPDYFRDWEAWVFGFGYGSGEPSILPALRRFLLLCGAAPPCRNYDHREVEKALGQLAAWLLINTLCRADIIEYGTSPRFGWLTGKGERLKAFVLGKTDDELIEIVCSDPPDGDFGCDPIACNCGPKGYDKARVCPNPFWSEPK